VSERAYKIGLRLAQIRFVRSAIDERADLNAFKRPPNLQIIAGVFAICLSFVICWPAISALGGVSIYFGKPLIVGVGGPVLYGLSHLCFIAGMALSGEKYSRIFLRWAARVGVEKLLSHGPTTGINARSKGRRNCKTATDSPARTARDNRHIAARTAHTPPHFAPAPAEPRSS
jgi:hypothetical protein